MSRIPLTDANGKPITGEGCGVPDCGVPRREHVQLWSPTAGWHGYEQPTPQQIAARRRTLQKLRDEQIITGTDRELARGDADGYYAQLRGREGA